MPRTVLTSIAKTCPACGATNTVVAATTEIRPVWRMNCSRCGAAIGADHGARREAGRTAERGTAGATGPEMRPFVAGKRKTPPRRRRRGGLSRCCTGFQMTAGAALGVLCTALLLDFGASPANERKTAADSVVLTAAPEFPVLSPEAPTLASRTNHRAAGTTTTSLSPENGASGAEMARAEPARDLLDRDPRLRDGDPVRTPVDPRFAAAAEAALDLSRRERREVQRRLALADHDPRLVDGIFGPATRAAILDWQAASGLPPTSYLDGQALARLERETEDRYRAWRMAEKARDRRRSQTAALVSPLPSPTPAGAGKCRRLWTGEIAYGQNVRCDLRGLRENVAQLLRGFERS